MIIDSFDDKSEAIINPPQVESKFKCDVCLITFSNKIEDYVKTNFNLKQVGTFSCVNGEFPIYGFEYENKIICIYKTPVGACASVGMIEDVANMIDTKKFLVFGSAGILNKDACFNKVIVPTYAYRDEGTSYHYTKPQDYIKIKNSNIVVKFLTKHNIPYIEGKIWTTDAFYRETKNNYQKRKDDGCIAVDMECSAMQAVCDFRNLDLFYFVLGGDLLDSPKWDKNDLKKANHNFDNFNIALHLALYIS